MSMVLKAVPVLACGLCMLPCVAMIVFGARRVGRSGRDGGERSAQASETRPAAAAPEEFACAGDRRDG